MNYQQHILLSNYQHVVYKLVFVKFQQVSCDASFAYRAGVNTSDVASYSHRLNHCSCTEQWAVLAYLQLAIGLVYWQV